MHKFQVIKIEHTSLANHDYCECNYLLFAVTYKKKIVLLVHHYYLGTYRQSCDKMCEKERQYCMSTDHGFPRDNASLIFNALNLSSAVEIGQESYSWRNDPQLNPRTNTKRGFLKIPFNIECVSYPTSDIQQICPCKNNPGTSMHKGAVYKYHSFLPSF